MGSVLDDDAGGGELVADRVGGGEVAAGAGELAPCESLLDPFGEGRFGAGGGAGEAEEAEDPVDAVEGVAGGMDVGGKEGTAAVEGGVGLADEGEEGGESGGDVQVVVECVFEGVDGAVDEGREVGAGCVVGDGSEVEAVLEVEDAAERGLSVIEPVEGEVELVAVVGGEEEVADGGGREATFEEVAEGEDVAHGLGHLVAVDEEVLDVEPVAGERQSGGALGLGDLVLVVGEDEVLAAGVDVEGLAEVGHAHGGALDVPPGSAGAPWGLPGGADPAVDVPGGLPEGEVADVALFVLVGGHALAAADRGEVDA